MESLDRTRTPLRPAVRGNGLRKLAAVVLSLALLGFTAPQASAATHDDFTPVTVLGPGVPPDGSSDQNVVALGTVTLSMSSTQTAYVVSVMRVNSATLRTLVDNEVVCKWAGGSKNMVVGQNVYKQGGGNAQWEDISLTTRYLLHPGVATNVTCTTYIRTASLGFDDSTVRVVSGYLRFADTSVANNTAGTAIQNSVPPGLRRVDATTPIVREPSLPMFDTAPGFTGLSVFGDTEYMVCHTSSTCDKSGSSQARFTLFVNQWKADGTLCHSDSSATVTKSVPYSVHHVYVPLHQPDFRVRADAGCIPRFNAYVLVQWLSGETGAVQGTAVGLTDSRGSTSKHNSDMSHAYAVPYTS
ncbi:hypothetical protein ABZ816_26345 [Actinosynnema sp. NPDC047251]|uniref:Putative secreted protein n=1 Tax=Saccharothrix espanaensis (strain ATCC 51144 / DSM 44229 / JCM 9112 / NBRC 15066 / NRRL 15764) TaxID=1179773 RepID=K0K6D1_SACES|nr:hypothetical protein [Saccharothrix espanaensis]CCH32088.1 putative secreted protein [Saccharothrix espanaensis DSM 44229]